MRHERPYAWQRNPSDHPTLTTTAPLVRTSPDRPTGHGHVAAFLAGLPSGVRALLAALLLLGTAELGVIAGYGGSRPSDTPTLALLVVAPLYAAGAAILLRAFGRLTHRAARMLGGSGDRRTTVETLVLLVALLALPAAAATLVWSPGSAAAAVVQLIVSVAALILGVRLVAYLQQLGQLRATLALLLPLAALVLVIIMVIAIHSALAPTLPAEWRIR